MTIRTIIADDEPLARERIRTLLMSHGDVEICAECRDGGQTLEALRKLEPDLLFLDVQMPEMSGLQVLDALEPGRMPAVIFVTAFDRYALQAFEVHALDYLLKPFDRQRFDEALGRVRAALASRGGVDFERRVTALLEEMEGRSRYLSHFAVKAGNRVLVVKVSEVDCIGAAGNYMKLFMGAQSHLIRETMADLEGRLNPRQFVRVHRSWIVNLEKVAELRPSFGGGYVVVLQGGRKVEGSRRFSGRIEEAIGGNR